MLKKLIFIVNYLIRNLQEIRKIIKLKYSKYLKLKPKLEHVSIFECICLLGTQKSESVFF